MFSVLFNTVIHFPNHLNDNDHYHHNNHNDETYQLIALRSSTREQTMVKRDFYVQTGRVAVVNYGKYAGKYVTIMDVADSARVLVDGPTSGVPRQLMPVKHLGLTSIRFRVPRTAKTSTLRKHLAVNKVDEKANKNSWVAKAKRAEVRANLNDFQRFQVYKLKKQRAAILRK